MAKTKVDAMWEDLKSKGYFQSDKATFDKYFYAPGEQGYKNRKALYDDLHNKGYLQSPTYEDFAQRIGLHATGNAGIASAHGTTQSMLPADVAERRIRTAKQPTPLNKSKARQRLMQQQQAIDRQQKQWQQQADRLRKYDEKRSTTMPGGMERLGERAQEHLATGQASPVPIAPNPEVVRGDMVMGDDGRMRQSYQVGSTPYSSRAGAEAVLYRQAHPLEDELQQAYLERERLQQEINRTGSSAYSANVGSGAAFMPQGAQAAAMYNSPEFAMLSSAYHKNEQRIKTLERERDADGFWSTLGKELFSLDTWDFGAQEFMDASTMMRYFDRDDLTEQERGARQSMLENAFAKNAADQQYGQNDTFMQRAASITAQALPFVAQFLATGGMSAITEGGAKLGANAAARWATGKVGEWMLKNTGVLLGDLAAGFAMANTVGILQTGADIMERRQGQLMMGPDGSFYFADGKSWGRSIWEGEAANTLEYYTEMLGAHLDGLLAGAIGRAAMRPEGKLLGGWLEEFGDKVGLGALSDVFSRITGSELQAVTTNILRRGGVNEIPSEIFEEEANLLLNAMLVGDNKISDLWDPKTQADIWGGMCLSVGFMQSPGVIGGAHQTAQYYRYKHATDVADQKARARLGDEQWDALKALLDGASNQEIPVVIANMRADSEMSTLGKTAVMDYAKNLLKMRGYNLRTAAEAKSQLQQPDEAQPAVKDESGTSFAEGYNAGEQDMEPIKNRLEAAQRALIQMGYDVGSLDGKQLQDFSQESLAGMPDDERAALLEFFNARAAFEGMRQKVNDDVDTQVQHASDLVDMQTNRDTGMMHRATLNNGQEVYVTVGRLVMTGDGTMVDTEASDESLFGYNTATGEVEQYTPQDFQSVDDPVNPAQAKAESAENIRREVAGRAAAAINGDLAFNDGDEFDILGGDNATHHIQVLGQQDEGHVVASIDGGEAQVIPKNELQAMHDNLKDAVKDMEDAVADNGNIEPPQSDGTVNLEEPVEEPFEMPLDEDGEPVWSESTPEQGYQYIKDGELADEDIDSIIATNLANAMAALEEARKDGKKNAIERARKEVTYWNAVDDMRRADNGEVVVPEAATPVAENEMKPVEEAPAIETPAEQEPTEQAPESKPEQRKSLSEETGVLAGDRETLAQSMSPRTLEMIHKIAQQLGLKIRVYNDPNAAGENGYFDGNSNTIWVNTARRTGKLASWVLGHEMTHAMDARATDKKSKVYKDFKRIAVSFVRSVEGIEAYEARIKRTMARYKNAPGVDASKVTRDYIEDEVACDMAGELLAEGPEFMERLFRDATDRNALERVLDAVRDFVDRMLSILNANSDEYRALTILRDSMNKMYNDVKIQGEISNELEPDADAEVETDITPADEERQERKDRQRAKRVKRKRAKRKSVTAIVEGAGLQASENVMETWKVPQADGTFKEEERWVKRPLIDDQGNVVFRMGDKEFNGNNPVSVEDLEENPDTVLNYMLNDAVNIGKLSEKKARQIRQKYADMLNAYLRRGMPTDEATGFENLEDSWMWVGEAAYKTVASNSDEQYSYSLDITRVCKKNEAVIRAISALQVKTGYGVTPGQIMDIYLTTDAEGYQVPCPVCYVFSRYINNGKYATAIVNGMQKYGKYLPGQAEEKDLAWWVDKYNEENAKAKKMKTPIDNANGDVKTILQNIDTLSREITSGTLSDEEREAKLRELHDMDERYRAALDVISQEAMPRWIKAFVLAGSAKDGWRMREDAAMPEDMDDFISHALDIRKTASAMVKYPAITRYRRAGGSAGGKEITFASNNDMGSIAMALGISKSNLDNFNNYYQLALEAGTEEERKALLEKARKRFGDARLYAQRQTLRGGQRMWSWSDNIETLASDVASNLMQLEMLGGALQTYSKQLEGVKLVAAMNGYVNASLMGYGDGVMEVDEDNITTDEEGRRVLAQDITEVNNKGRERIIANAGSPIYRNEDGKDYVLVFDDVVGIDPFGHEGNDGKFRRGLFALNEEYDRAGNILVGMNDIHVRAAMADPRVFFIIPWHASGMSNHILMQMFRVLGVDTENFKATDYTKMQEETNFLERTEKGKIKHKVTQAVRDFWNSHTYEGEFRSGIGHIPNGDRKDGLSRQQLHYRELRDAIFDGTIDNEDKKDWKRQVERDEFLSQVYRQVTTRVDDGKMTEKDKEFIYPYEYWDESSTYETADINGKRYLEYCRRMGFKPKFTGRYDEKAGYSPEGNFADDPGYWKLLIDRRMYDREGKFQDLTPVDSEGLESSMYDPMETQKEFNVTEVATNEGAERIADIVYQQEVERSGSMPTPNLSTTLEDAVEQYKDTVKRQAARVKAENDAKKAEEAARIKAEKAAERARKKAEREAEMAKQRKSLGDIIDEALQSAAIPQPEEANDSNIRYSLRTKPAPKKTLPVYKLMRLGDDGKLYPLYIDGAVPIELGQWYDADSPNMEMLVNLPAGVHLINPETGEATSLDDYNKQRGITKKSKYPSAEAVNEATANGMRWVYIEPTKGGQRRFGGEARRYWNLGINGSGTVSTYSMRPGWHAGSLPTMRQIGKGPGRNMRDDRFVWVEGEISADVDYNEEAQGNPDNDIPTHIPVDGFYLKATNANAKASQADRVGWYISGAFKANRIMSDSEARDVIDAWNADPKHKDMQVEYDFPRESGKVFNAETMQLEDDDNGPDGPKGGKRFSIDDAAYAEAVEAGDQKKVTRMVKDAVKAAMPNTKAVDRWGKPRLLYHGTPQENQFYEFDGTIYLSSNRSVANEYTHYRRTFGANPRQTGRIMPVFVNLENPLEIDANRHLWRNIDVEWSDTPVTTMDIEQYAKDNGYDGVIIKRVRDNMYDNDTTAADVYIAFSPEQVKSAGPTYEQKKRSHFPWDDYMELDGEVGATYDEEGNLIPLSQRFDMGKRDIRYSLDAAVAEAEQMTETNPTEGQKESGNYKKGHVKVDGFDISIEQPKGSVRSGVDADGNEWSQEMHNTYGYIRGTEGVDGDHIDVFLSDHLDGWNGNVYVVDQVNKDRSFDEHKVMYGFNSEQEARDAYLSNYEEGWTGLGNITGVSREEFKKWVDSSHRKNKPFAEYKNVKPLQSTNETGARFSLKDDEERTLMGMHNITAEKLRSALKLGGLANPSMAVVNTEVGGFTNFGEISLIPSSDLIASRTGGNAGTWGADAYSPRFPETHRRLGKGGDKKMRTWVKGLGMRQEMEYNTEEQFNDYYNGFNIRDNALVYPFLHEKGLSGEVDYYTHMNVDQRLEDDLREVNGDQWALLKRFDEDEEYKKKLTDIVVGDELRKISKKDGETFQEFRDRRREWAKQIRDGLTGEDGYINRNLAEDLLYAQARAYRENGKFSESRTVSNAEQYIRDHGMEEEYKQYFEQKMQELGAELQVYAGSDSQGRSKYKPVSLEQVSRMMKKQGRAGGEGGIFADSPGAIRAKLLTPMKTLDQIRAKKDRLVSHEAFEQFRERYQEELREYADVYARGSMGALADIITSSNMAATAKQYNIDLDADAVAELNKFKNRVRALPTEYFETKFERPVMLDEFKKAIIPDDLPLDLQGALQRAGLEVVEYKHGDNADRERVTLDAVKNDDSIRFSIQGLDGYTEQDVLDGVRGDIEAKLEKAGVDDVTIKGMALHGSRMRGDARDDSDLDVVMEYDGDWSEDALFDLLNDEPVYFDGIKVDINPITRGKSGTLEQYMERSRRYDEEKIRANSAQYNDTADSVEMPRYSLSGDGTVEAYNKAVNMTGRTFNMGGREVKPGITRYNFQEAFQDSILAVKKLQQVVERHFGIKLPTRENAWMYENRLSSINMHERKSFIDKVYEPMMKIADSIMKRGVKEKELNAYLICKHGLERNQVFAQRDANEEANEIVRNGGTPDMQQLIDKYRQRDYSGLTGVTGIQGDIADIEAEAQRIVDEFEQKHGQLCNELWDAIRKATQWSLRKSYQSGMMSAATFDYVRNMFQYYVPLRGWSETTAEDVYSYMMGEHGAFNGVLKRAEGRTSVADDPLATIGNMAESALMQGNKNLLKQHLLRMAQNHPTDVCQVRDVWLVEGPGGVWEPHWPNIPDDATPDEIDQILQDHENDMLQLEASGSAKRVRNNLDIPYRIDPRHVPEHAVVAKVAGVDHVVYINGNPRAAQAINGQTGAGRGTKSGFSRLIDFIFGDMKRFYSSVLTSLNINFSGANFVRDLPHAYAMTFIKQGPLKAAEYIARSFQVIPWVFKNQLGKTGTSQMDRYFQEFLSSGSVTGYAHINDVDAWKADNKRRFARLSALGKARVAVPRALGEVINAIGWFSETLELIPRFTAFLVERESGKDIATATKAAKDITTNFNKKGSEVTPGVWGAVANTLRYMKMFFNPIVQGMYQFVDVASMGKENKWVGPRMVLATMHLPVLGAIVPYLNQFLLEALGGDDDDDYWLINEYTRRNNVCIFTGNGYVKIPIAPVFREMYGMGEVVATRHAGKADNEKTVIDLIDQLRTMGSVEGQSSYNEWSLARFLLPEHFAPLIDVMNNENFTGGPIYYDNNYKEYAPEYTKAKKSTWSPLVAASKWLNEMMGGDEDIAAGNSGKWMNPAVWQHLITNIGGGFAQLAGDVVSGITDITEGKEIDASNMPVLKRFYSNSSDERAQWARFGIYKDFEKDYTLAKEKYQALDKRGLSLTERADEMVKFAESHPRAAAIYAVWEGGIKGADIPARLEKLGKDDPAYWDLVKEAVGKAEKAMNSGYVRAWEQKRKDRPDSMSDKELDSRFDKSDNDSIRHIMADEISKRAGSQDYYGRDAQATWSDKSVAAWEAYQDQRTSDDIKADAELSNLLKVDEDEKDKARIKMLGYIKDELNKIRRGKDATSRSAGVKGLGEGDDERIMEELRAARKQLIEDLKSGSAEQAYRNLERRTMRLGLRKKAKEL